jgi:hypothetical protein
MPTAGTGEIISGLLLECEKQAENPPNVRGVPDKYISMFALALRDCLGETPDASQEQLEYAVNIKKTKGPFPSSFVFNSLLRSFQMRFMYDSENPRRYNLSYPFETQEQWNDYVCSLIASEEEFKQLTYDMIMWNVGSDVETRAAGPKLIANTLHKERVDNPDESYKILSIGSARNHTLAMLGGNIPFPEVGVDSKGLSKKQQQNLQQYINKLLSQGIKLGDSVGVDMYSLREEDWSRYLESCRFYPLELKDLVKRYLYNYLEGVRDANPNIHHVHGDYGEDPIELEYKFDLVAAMTSFYQSHLEKRRVMFDLALRDVKEDGLILVQDFCKIDKLRKFENPIDQLKFLGPTSKPFTYGMFVFDPTKPELGFQVFAYWNNGRCEIIRPAKMLLDILIERQKVIN